MVEISSLAIINYYKSLPKAERVAFRKKVLDTTDMSYVSFYNKLKGPYEFTKSERLVISQLMPQEYVEQSRVL